MKNFLLCLSAIIVIAIIFLSKEKPALNVSDLLLANIEALASGETSGGQRITCYKKLDGLQGAPMEDKTWCAECKARPASKWSSPSECIQ